MLPLSPRALSCLVASFMWRELNVAQPSVAFGLCIDNIRSTIASLE